MATGEQIIEEARRVYIDQFREFLSKRRAEGGDGVAEAMLSVNPRDRARSPEYRGVFCVDYLAQFNGQTRFWEFDPPQGGPTFAPISGARDDMDVTMNSFAWNHAHFFYEPDSVSLTNQIEPWFQHWFDPGGARFRADAEFTEAIHWLVMMGNCVVVDFGTAPSLAFTELLEVFARAGVRSLRIESRLSPGGAN